MAFSFFHASRQYAWIAIIISATHASRQPEVAYG